MDSIKFFILTHKPQFVFFMVFMAACIPMLFYYRKRHANPRFRPTAGEMTLVSIFAVMMSAGIAFGLGGLFNEKQDFSKFTGKPEMQDNGTISTMEDNGSKSGKGGKDSGKKATDGEKAMGILMGSGQ